jgi:hypothetical protein
MNKIPKTNSKGQVLIIVVLMLIGLLAMLALVLDGGNVYTHRRQMQAAADAGALAGARHLCGEDPQQSLAWNAAWDYAVVRNDAQDATIEFPEEGLIEVTTNIEFDPFFVHIIGISDLSASAFAAARCAVPSYGSVMPIAWNCTPPEPEGEGEEPPEGVCDFALWDEDGPPEPLTDYLYVFMDSISDDFDCIYPPNTTPYDSDSDWIEGTYDCDWDDDGENDVFDASDRGWLDIDGIPNDGANDIRDKLIAACGGEGGEYIRDHTWVGGKPGGETASFLDVKEYCEGKEVIIPVFDATCGDPTNEPETVCVFDPEHFNPPDEYVPRQGASYYYHIVAFASFHITCVHASGSDSVNEQMFPDPPFEKKSRCPGRNMAHLSAGQGFYSIGTPLTIEGYLTDNISPDVGGLGGYDSGTYIIYLVK